MRERQRGFSLLELAIGITLLSLVTMLAAGSFGPWMKFRQGLVTETRLREIQVALETAYREESFQVDALRDAAMAFRGGALTDASRTSRQTLAGLAPYAVHGGEPLYADGFNQPYWVFVSPRLRRSVEGVDLHYHVAAVVSGGANGALDPGTVFDREGGVLTLGGDDSGVVVDGFPIARAHYAETLLRLRRIADAYQAYFRSRFLSDPRRDAAVDYFSAPCSSSKDTDRWDAQGPATVANSCGDAMPIGSGELRALGIDMHDSLDSFGRPIRIENASATVRNPDNPESAMDLPPYTARVLTSLPGDVVVAVAVTGSY